MTEKCNTYCVKLAFKMKTLIRQMGRDDIRTTESLLIDMTGNTDAGRMLQHLLQWWPSAKNPDGWVYKSHVDWWAELRINQKQLARAKGALEAVGVEIKIKKANGSPTRHYRLHIRPFLKALARALKTTLRKIFTLWRENPNDPIGKMDLANGGKSITHTPTEEIQHKQVCVFDPQILEEVMLVAGMAGGTARGLIRQYGNGRVLAVARYASRNNLGTGWVITELRDDRYGLGEADMKPSESWAETMPAESVTHGDEADHEESTAPTPTDEKPVDVNLSEPEKRAGKRWDLTLSMLENGLARAEFDAWLRGAAFGSYSGGVYTIAVKSATAAAQLERRFSQPIRGIVSDSLGEMVQAVRFETMEVAAA